MGWLSDFFSNPIETTWNTAAQLPGSPEGGLTGLYNGVNGDLSWNPYDPDGPSVWEYGAAGTKLPENDEDRKWGRMFGTAVGSAFTGGALGSAMGSSVAGGAASGALWSGAQTAGAGGNSSEIGKSALRGAAVGGGTAAIPSTAGYAGISDPQLATAFDGAVRGGVGAAATGGNREEILQGAAFGGAPGLASYAAGAVTPYFQTLNDMPGTIGGNMADSNGETSATLGGDATLAQMVANDQRKQALSSSRGEGSSVFESPALTQFFDRLTPTGPSGWGDMAQGLMGMYSGYRQRRDAKKMQAQYGPNRAAYGQQLQQQLARRDAASGRRSDYGGRAVELQAKLADLDSRNAPMMSQLSTQSTMGLANMLQSGLRYGGKAGWFGDKYNPNVPTAPATSTMLPSTWTQPQPTNMDLNYDPALGRNRYKLGGG